MHLVRPTRPATRSAFTLIEVLVVVAIIALLLSILLPSLKKARDQAKSAVCKASLHDFGVSMFAYSADHKSFFPLPSYIGSTVWFDNPGADDNLFVLWLFKYTRDPKIYTCAGTTHKVRTPERIVKVPVANKGIRYEIYTAGELRNDFEFHGQLKTQLVQHPSARTVQVNGFGSSYEYGGWVGSDSETSVNWYPLNVKGASGPVKRMGGEPLSTKSSFTVTSTTNGVTTKRRLLPSKMMVMKDADEGTSTGGDVVGAPPGKATNNIPEPWDNHGAKYSNVLYADSHVETLGTAWWEVYMRAQQQVGQ